MIYTDMTKKAIRLAFEAHAGQYDKSGLPYILHPIHLAELPIDMLSLIEPDQERVAAHMADQKRQQRKITDRLAYLRQSTKRISREAYAEAIDEQRQRQATVTSLEARRAELAKARVTEKASGRRKAASAGENAVRSMIAASGEALLKRGAR